MLALASSPGSGVVVLAKSAVAVVCPADTSEDTLATITVPAGAMGPNGFIRITTVWSCTNGANNKQFRIRFSGIGGTQYFGTTQTTITATSPVTTVIANRGVANSQVGGTIGATSSGGVVQVAGITSAVDTSAASTIVITGQKASAGDTLTLESYLVELVYGA